MPTFVCKCFEVLNAGVSRTAAVKSETAQGGSLAFYAQSAATISMRDLSALHGATAETHKQSG